MPMTKRRRTNGVSGAGKDRNGRLTAIEETKKKGNTITSNTEGGEVSTSMQRGVQKRTLSLGDRSSNSANDHMMHYLQMSGSSNHKEKDWKVATEVKKNRQRANSSFKNDGKMLNKLTSSSSSLKEKGRKPKTKAPRKPKRPKTAYNFFQLSVHRSIWSEVCPDKSRKYDRVQHNEKVARIIGKRWKALTSKERKYFQSMADRDKIRCEKENQDYIKRMQERNGVNLEIEVGVESRVVPPAGHRGSPGGNLRCINRGTISTHSLSSQPRKTKSGGGKSLCDYGAKRKRNEVFSHTNCDDENNQRRGSSRRYFNRYGQATTQASDSFSKDRMGDSEDDDDSNHEDDDYEFKAHPKKINGGRTNTYQYDDGPDQYSDVSTEEKFSDDSLSEASEEEGHDELRWYENQVIRDPRDIARNFHPDEWGKAAETFAGALVRHWRISNPISY